VTRRDDAPRCELRAFADWQGPPVRFCAETTHAHDDDVPTFDAEEIAVLLVWGRGDDGRPRPLSPDLRRALLELKLFGGRVDPSTLDELELPT
jgi:hypothetical protein